MHTPPTEGCPVVPARALGTIQSKDRFLFSEWLSEVPCNPKERRVEGDHRGGGRQGSLVFPFGWNLPPQLSTQFPNALTAYPNFSDVPIHSTPFDHM